MMPSLAKRIANALYVVVDGQTKKAVGVASTMKRARASAERKNLDYGAHRYYASSKAMHDEFHAKDTKTEAEHKASFLDNLVKRSE